jgi:hypothetical protein
VALGARRGGGGFGHRPVQLEGVAAGAAAKVIARHGDRVWLRCDSSSPWLPGLWMTHRARSMGAGGRCRPVVSFGWRTGRTDPRSGAGHGLRRRILTGPLVVPARRLRRRFWRRARWGATMPGGRLVSPASQALERPRPSRRPTSRTRPPRRRLIGRAAHISRELWRRAPRVAHTSRRLWRPALRVLRLLGREQAPTVLPLIAKGPLGPRHRRAAASDRLRTLRPGHRRERQARKM